MSEVGIPRQLPLDLGHRSGQSREDLVVSPANAAAVALVERWPDWIMVAVVAGVFFVGQFIEGNILQPRLVGKSVGLHPVWLMFSLFAFGALFGFVGLLIAVPAAAAVAVLVRFAIARYLESPLYQGHVEEEEAVKLEVKAVAGTKPEA